VGSLLSAGTKTIKVNSVASHCLTDQETGKIFMTYIHYFDMLFYALGSFSVL
jgi:hypothetical protein